ncbi:MAG: MBL fold metallo-hydrolase [Desulfurococcales archaeon]|nr:MBL fold metallo-hydrolase [Desulfurococcales archaeon]
MGQGLFSTLDLTNNHSYQSFSAIYDCGSENKASLKTKINNYKKQLKNNKIDILFISHLHYDHTSGLPILLKNVSVEVAVLPYINVFERLLIAIEAVQWGIEEEWYYELLSDPVAFLRERGVKNVFFLVDPREGYGGGRRPFVPPPNDTGGEDKDKNHERRPRDKEDYNISIKLRKIDKDNIINHLENIYHVNLNYYLFKDIAYEVKEYSDVNFYESLGYISVNDKKCILYFSPFTKSISWKKLCKFISCVKKINRNIKDIIKDKNLLKNLKCCYTKINKDLNYTSMAIITGTCYKYHIIYFPKCHYCCYYNYLCKYIFEHKHCYCHLLNKSKSILVLYTGDLPLFNDKICEEFCNYYKHLLDNICVYQIPHHGSKTSYNSKLGLCACSMVVSYGLKNKYNHPDTNVLQQYEYHLSCCIKSIFHVTENNDVHYRFFL